MGGPPFTTPVGSLPRHLTRPTVHACMRPSTPKTIRCPACLSADSDEFVLFLHDAMPPASLLLSSIDGGGAGGREQAQQALRAVEGLRPSDQALYLYAHKVREGVWC